METGNDKIFKYPVGNGALENSITIITGKGEQVWIGAQKGLLNINYGLMEKTGILLIRAGYLIIISTICILTKKPQTVDKHSWQHACLYSG